MKFGGEKVMFCRDFGADTSVLACFWAGFTHPGVYISDRSALYFRYISVRYPLHRPHFFGPFSRG